MTRVLFYTNEPVLAHGVSEVISTAAGLEMRHVCTSISQVRECAADTDVLVMDVTSEVTFVVLSELQSAAPECKIVLWVNTISTELAYQVMGLGIRGILRRTLGPELIVKCIHRVHQGELVLLCYKLRVLNDFAGDVILNGDGCPWLSCRSVSRTDSPSCGCGGGSTSANRGVV
jgi:DNA-binding NarL/FixJ family response regulator